MAVLTLSQNQPGMIVLYEPASGASRKTLRIAYVYNRKNLYIPSTTNLRLAALPSVDGCRRSARTYIVVDGSPKERPVN
jgi:hypothetical protein